VWRRWRMVLYGVCGGNNSTRLCHTVHSPQPCPWLSVGGFPQSHAFLGGTYHLQQQASDGGNSAVDSPVYARYYSEAGAYVYSSSSSSNTYLYEQEGRWILGPAVGSAGGFYSYLTDAMYTAIRPERIAASLTAGSGAWQIYVSPLGYADAPGVSMECAPPPAPTASPTPAPTNPRYRLLIAAY
jgi:hypothetical protein